MFENELKYSVSKAVFYNIEVMSNYLCNNLQLIAKIVKKMDPSYPDLIDWSKDNTFAFTGQSVQSDDVYQIDLMHGRIYKNGKEISALDPQIKDNKYFKEIFTSEGKDREFQVFQSHNANFLRTKNKVNHLFKIP